MAWSILLTTKIEILEADLKLSLIVLSTVSMQSMGVLELTIA